MKDHERRAFYAIGKAVCDRFRLPEADPRRTANSLPQVCSASDFAPPPLKATS